MKGILPLFILMTLILIPKITTVTFTSLHRRCIWVEKWRISPSILPLWIKDVMECCALLHVNRDLFPQDSAKYGQDGYGDYGNSDYSLSFGLEKEYAVNKNFEHDSENKDLAYNLSNGIASNPSKASHLLSANNEEMSLVSNLYIFMDKVKRDCLNLKN